MKKTIKHFMGWLFGYCPYGHGCPPKHPFKKDDHDDSAIDRRAIGGGGC